MEAFLYIFATLALSGTFVFAKAMPQKCYVTVKSRRRSK